MKNSIYKLRYVFIAFFLLLLQSGYAQGVGVNATGASPDPSAGLDVDFNDKGFLLPRLTTAQRDSIVSPALGLMIYNTSNDCINMWTGTTWRQSCFDCGFSTPVPGNNGPLCEGSSLNLTVTSIPGAAYQWSGPNGFTSTLQNPVITNATSAANGLYSVVATLNGCTSSPQNTFATINTTPVTPTAGNDGPVCVGGTLNLSASTIVGATYTWTGPNGYSANVQNPVITNAQATHAGVYTVVANVNGCVSAAGSTTVVVNAAPAAPGIISGPVSACPGSTGNVYSVVAVPNATSYNWTVPAGSTITSGSSSDTITVTFGSTAGNVTVTASSACGTSSASTLAVGFTPQGQVQYTTPGTYTWVVPAGVTSVSVLCIGGGGGTSSGNPGGNSSFGSVLTANGGSKSSGSTGGAGGGGSAIGGSIGGGNGGTGSVSGGLNAGGGGAGGYGGNGSNATNTGNCAHAGGGVGIFGGSGAGGGGGSNVQGTPASGGSTFTYGGGGGNCDGGSQGGGGGGGLRYITSTPVTPGNSVTVVVGAAGTGSWSGPGTGAVRIIWGCNRAYPSTNTQNM